MLNNQNKSDNQPKRVTELDITVAKNLKRHRLLNGVTLKELSQKLSISVQQLQKYESYKNRIPASKLHSISKLFRTTTNSFFDEEKISIDTISIDTDCKKFLTAFSCIKKAGNRAMLLKIMNILKD